MRVQGWGPPGSRKNQFFLQGREGTNGMEAELIALGLGVLMLTSVGCSLVFQKYLSRRK